MADLLVRRVPEHVMKSLKQRAVRHRRSLQQEVMAILEFAAAAPDGRNPAEVAAAIRARLARSNRRFTDSTPLIRDDRAR